jgi:phosphoenolpyruvate---glycerone phosphotransferase subunit DhaL
MPVLAARMTLSSARLAAAVDSMSEAAPMLRDVLNEADRHLGDGDTGMTVERVVLAMREAAVSLPPDVGAALAALSKACAQSTGSSLGSVIAIGLAAAARRAREHESLDRPAVAGALQGAIDAIQARSGARPGDKTMLDSLIRIHAALADVAEGTSMLEAARAASADALQTFRPLQSRLGRARMYGERSAGHDDPGMLAIDLLLRAAATAAQR